MESPRLELSRVQKLTSRVRPYQASSGGVRSPGTHFVPIEPNSFGLPSVASCPGRTTYCERDCYAMDAERRPDTLTKLERNLEKLLAAETVEEMTDMLRDAVNRYRNSADKLGVDSKKRRFRIHWDGDFFSEDYASAWRTVIQENPEVRFWAYTRSFGPEVNVVPILAGVDNLDLFMSVDSHNLECAAQVLAENPGVKVAYLVDYHEDAEPMVERLGRQVDRQLSCPENMLTVDGEHKLPLVDGRGGACSKCTYCIDKPSSWDVVFVKTGQAQRIQQALGFLSSLQVELRRKPKVAPSMIGATTLSTAEATLY